MKYVKAEWVTPAMEGAAPMIKATGDDGVEYWIPDENTDVPPWPEFVKEGGKIAPAAEPEAKK